MFARLKHRYRDLVASVYLYNEYRGYSSLDRILNALRAIAPDDLAFIAAVEKHREDERKHFLMFRNYFEGQQRMPFLVDKSCAHIDRLIRMTFGCDVDGLETERIIAEEPLFAKLCRVIILTEQRGIRQIDILLRNRILAEDRTLVKIFNVIERDEPSHWLPYDGWLRRSGGYRHKWRERMADQLVHLSLVLVKLPLLFIWRGLPRRTMWQDEEEAMRPAQHRLRHGASG